MKPSVCSSPHLYPISLMAKGVLSLVWLMLMGLAQAQATSTPDPLAAQNAPTARFEVSMGAPNTGVAFTLMLRVDVPQGVILLDWPTLPDAWGDFEILAREERTETPRDNGGRVVTQRFTVRVWRVGDHTTPQTMLAYRVEEVGDFRVPIRPAFVTVPTVLDFNDLTLRPPLPPIDLPYLPPLLAVGVLAVLFVFSWWLMGVLTTRTQRETYPLTPSAYEVAVRQLEALREPPHTADEVLSGTADAIREYLAARLQMNIAAATTLELTQAADAHLPLELVAGVTRLFAEADRVKYASKITDDASALQALDFAVGWLRDAESALGDASKNTKNDAIPTREGA